MKEKVVGFFLKKKLKKSKERSAEMINSSQVKQILLVMNDYRPDLAKFTAMEFDGADTVILCKGNKKLKESAPLNTVIISASDFGFNGSIKNDELLELVQRRFDLLIDLNENDIILDYLISKINTKLIIGLASEENESKIHDIFVPHHGKDEAFISQIKETLNLISK